MKHYDETFVTKHSWWNSHDKVFMMKHSWWNIHDETFMMKHSWWKNSWWNIMMKHYDETFVMKHSWWNIYDKIFMMKHLSILLPLLENVRSDFYHVHAVASRWYEIVYNEILLITISFHYPVHRQIISFFTLVWLSWYFLSRVLTKTGRIFARFGI